MNRLVLIVISAALWLASGCTASDRDYVRNHIVQVDTRPKLPKSVPVAHATSSLPDHQ